jgi:Putative lumazine-binding
MKASRATVSAGLALMSAAVILCEVATPLHAATPATTEEQAVMAPINGILEGLTQRDHAKVRDQLLPGGMATLIRDGKTLQIHFDAFVERIPTTGTVKLEERLYDPQIRIDDDIAVVWSPYTVFFDGKIDHCGTNIFSLIRRDGRWLISNVADNSRRDCPVR